MTSGASKCAFTSTKPIQVDVIVDGNVQKVVTFFGLKFRILNVFSEFMILPLWIMYIQYSPEQCASPLIPQPHR